MRRKMARLFEYAVILNEKLDKDGNVTDPAEIIVPVTHVAATDESRVQMIAARAIPEELVANGKFDRLTVVVRPF